MTTTQEATPAGGPHLPKIEDLLKRLEALEIAAGIAPRPPRKETITAYYKTPAFKAEEGGKDETPAQKTAREARNKAGQEQAGKVVVHELPPIVFEEAKNGRVVTTELPHPVDDGAGHQKFVVAKWVTPEDADAWSLEDPDKGKHEAAAGSAQAAPKAK